jgi:nucleoside diphosphate kinase
MYNLDFKDVAALESSGVNVNSVKKLILGIVQLHLHTTENNLKVDFEHKINKLNHEFSHIQTIVGPLRELTAHGKSLNEGILDYIMSSDGIVKVVDKAKDQIISSKQMLSAFTPASAFKGYQGELEKAN